MACISKISADYTWSCNLAQIYALGQVDEIVFINSDDVVSVNTTDPSRITITRAVGTKGYLLQSVNNGVKVNLAKKGGDVFTNLLDPTVIVLLPNTYLNSQSEGQANTLVNSEVFIAVKSGTEYYVLGVYSPLVCTEIAGDSSTSPFITATFGVEEWQTGSTKFGITKAIYEGLKTAAK